MARQGQVEVRQVWTPEELAKRAQSLFIDQGAPQPAKSWQWWQRNRKMVEAMAVVIAACDQSHADPELYVQAQVESVGLVGLAHGRGAMAPGCFRGDNADQRFARWMSRKNSKRASLVRHRDDVQDREKRLGAAQRFGEAFLAWGATRADAVEAAQECYPGWVPENLAPVERWEALVAGCEAVQPGLADQVIVEATWTWREARDFLDRAAPPPAAAPESQLPSVVVED